MTRVISIASAKGGVGKTTIAANLSAALSGFRKSVIAIDANLTTPNLGLHLGVPMFPKTLHDVLRGNAKIHEAAFKHDAGFFVIPAGLSFNEMKDVDIAKLSNVLSKLVGKADMIIVDCAAGLGREATTAMKYSDEMIVVTNPELPAVADALKAVKVAEKNRVKPIGAVVNRINNHRHEMSVKEIEEMLSIPVISSIPEDIWVKRSIAARMPVVNFRPDAPASIEMKALAAKLAGVEYKPSLGFAKRFFGWFFE